MSKLSVKKGKVACQQQQPIRAQIVGAKAIFALAKESLLTRVKNTFNAPTLIALLSGKAWNRLFLKNASALNQPSPICYSYRSG